MSLRDDLEQLLERGLTDPGLAAKAYGLATLVLTDHLQDRYGWVQQLKTIDATDTEPANAMMENPGWRLLAIGSGAGGQTTLTFGWPWRDNDE